MKINTLKINSFGKLNNKEIELKDGINIIYGNNESGKSTLLNFIVSTFYGILKNKRGKEFSNYDIYKPWVGEEFSGKIEYELDNKEKFEVYREFNKKNPKILNSHLEDISKQFNIDKNKGNEFFYEQTGVDEELFETTVLVKQQEVELEKNQETSLIQKITNIVGTGKDNVSFKKAIKNLDKKQLDEIGTSRSRGKPINILEEKIDKIRSAKKELEIYEDEKYDIDDKKMTLVKKIYKIENEVEFLKKEEKIENEANLEKEKLNLKIELIEKNNKKIEELKNEKKQKEKFEEMEKIETNTKEENEMKQNKIKKSKIILVITIILALATLVQAIIIKNEILNIILPTITIIAIMVYILIKKYEKNIKIKEKENEKLGKEETNQNENIENKLEFLKIENEIKILTENNETLNKEVEELKNEIKEKINKYRKQLEEKFPNLEITNSTKEEAQNELNQKKLQIHTIEIDKQNIEKKLDKLAQIEEELNINDEKYKQLKNQSEAINIAKDFLEKAYVKMKNEVTPQFTNKLSQNIAKITQNKYTNVKYNDEKGLIVELENGNYVSPYRLSTGTIDQLYLSLRFSMIDDLAKEKMPIILDEAFAYYDEKRLKNVLKYLAKEAEYRQVLILTCTNRECDILQKENEKFTQYKI